MQAKKQSRPLEWSNSETEIGSELLISADPQTAARAAQLLRLGIISGGASKKVRPDGAMPVENLRAHADRYLEDLALNNKLATIAAKAAAYKKLFWYLKAHGHETCGEREIRALLTYVKNAHLLPDGRWGRGVIEDAEHIRFIRPATARTIEYYFVYIRAFYRWMLECEIIEHDPTARIKIDKPARTLIEPFSLDQVETLYKAGMHPVLSSD